MPYGIRKKAGSSDPRDWNYLRYWQEWGTYMPPWMYAFKARSEPPAPGFPFWDVPVCFAKDPVYSNVTETGWKANVSIPSSEPPYTTTLFDFACGIVVVSKDAGATDPDGNPITMSISGSVEIPPFPIVHWTGYFNLPAYDDVFSFRMLLSDGTESTLYPFGMQMYPRQWNQEAFG